LLGEHSGRLLHGGPGGVDVIDQQGSLSRQGLPPVGEGAADIFPALLVGEAALRQGGLRLYQQRRRGAAAPSLQGEAPAGKRALLVDDIYSTGATMQEAARVLSEQGLIVYGAAAAFTPRLSPPC